MHSTHAGKDRNLHKIFLINIGLGFVAFAAAVYFIIAGEYPSLDARKHAETLLNGLALGGLLYGVAFWYLDQFLRPLPHGTGKSA